MMKRFIATLAISGFFTSFAFAQDFAGTVPVGGGPITITNSGDDATNWLGLDISATGGLDGSDPAPFSITLLNTPTQVVVGNLGNPVTLAKDASVTTGVTWDGTGEFGVTTWGNGTDPVAFPVAVVPEPASGLMACFAALGLLGFRRRR